MPDHAALYCRKAAPLGLEVLRREAPGASVTPVESAAAPGWSGVELRWPDVTLTLTTMSAGDATFEKHLAGFLTQLGGRLGAGRFELLESLARTREVIAATAAPRWDEGGKCQRLVLAIAREQAGLLFRDQRLLDAHERTLLGPDGGADPSAEVGYSPSAIARRARSEERVRSLGAQVNPSLPPIEGDDEARLRSAPEVARRAIPLWAVAVRAEGLEQDHALRLLTDTGLWEAASARERAFLEAAMPDPREVVHFTWMYECLWVLLWALGRVEVLHSPTAACDVPRAASIMIHTPPALLIDEARLRPVEQILDEADFTYRLCAGLKEVESIDPGVALERRRTFRWLTHHLGKEWDRVLAEG